MQKGLHATFLALLVMAASLSAMAAPPAMMNTQGVLLTQSGAPVADGIHALSFSLYVSSVDPSPLWTENNDAVAIQGGFYSALLGAATQIPPSLFQNHSELWLGVKVNGGSELPRGRLLTVAYAFEANHALIATAAESLQCSGCLSEETLGFDLGTKIQDGSKAACYDTLAELRAILDTVYAPLNHTHGGGDITSPVAQCLQAADALGLEGRSLAQVKSEILSELDLSAYLKKGDKIDQSQLPANGLDEVSNGILRSQFTKSFPAADLPLEVKDYFPPGITSSLNIPDVGLVESIRASVRLSNSAIQHLSARLTDPDGATYILFDGGASGTTLDETYPEPNAPVSGDLATWSGRNPKGTWTLTIIDSHFDGGTTDGTLNSWSLTISSLSSSNLLVTGNVTLNGSLSTQLVAGELIDTMEGPQAIFVSPTDNRVHLADSDSLDAWAVLGFAGFATAGQKVPIGEQILIQAFGVVPGFSGLSAGFIYYLTSIAGSIGSTPGAVTKPVGMALSSNLLQLIPTVDSTTMNSIAFMSSSEVGGWDNPYILGFSPVVFGPDNALRRFTQVSVEYRVGTSTIGGQFKLTAQVSGEGEVTIGESEVTWSTYYRGLSIAVDIKVPAGKSVTFRAYGSCISGPTCAPSLRWYMKNLSITGKELFIEPSAKVRANSPW
jgi:subtilisin-like proprotein convertase family protein